LEQLKISKNIGIARQTISAMILKQKFLKVNGKLFGIPLPLSKYKPK